jgi:6-phosphogluconate dehydrogenase
MGANMARRLLLGGHRVVAYDISETAIQSLEAYGAQGASTLSEAITLLDVPRSLWVMLPSGDISHQVILNLAELLSPGDTIIDGGNSNYKDTQQRARLLKERGIGFIDVGTSGGIWGLTEGYSLMIGGDKQVVERHRPIFEALAPAPDKGWGYVGPSGAGHFVKMIHNGIEYGLMQAYAEGFEILQAKDEFGLDLHQIAEIWRYGSVVRSWLLDLTSEALAGNPELRDIKGWVADSGEGRWTVSEAVDLEVAAPVITLALLRRLRSRSESPFSDRLLAALRNQFGGHAVIKPDNT